MLFQLVPTKYFQSALFLCLPKVDQVINVQKAYREMTPKRNVIRVEILTSRPCLLRELEPDSPNSYSKPPGAPVSATYIGRKNTKTEQEFTCNPGLALI